MTQVTDIFVQTPTQLYSASDNRKKENLDAHSLLLRLDVSSRCSLLQTSRAQDKLPSFHDRICRKHVQPFKTVCVRINIIVGWIQTYSADNFHR